VIKPIFKNKWFKTHHGKKPSLQINILKETVRNDELSKRKATGILRSNYPDISDAMGVLIDLNFLEFSRKSGRRMPEKFYKITEEGLRALLSVVEDLFENEFWKVVILLCICSKRQISYDEFEEYYNRFEKGRMGHSTINKSFFQPSFFDSVLDKWLQDQYPINYNPPLISLPQKIMECLSLNRSITLQQLAKNTNTNEEDIAEVLKNYTVQKEISSNTFVPESESIDLNIQRKIYFDFMRSALIVTNKTSTSITYELSLFGIMLTMALIRYHYVGIDNVRCPHVHTDGLPLFYSDITQEEYYDRIAHNYPKKLPLIFAKWDLLKKQLGSTLLYDNFDFMIYRETSPNNISQSIWFGGNKEFYQDIQSLANNARHHMSLIYILGRNTLQTFQKYPNIMSDPEGRITPIHRKLYEIQETLKYMDITSFVNELRKVGNRELSSFGNMLERKSSHSDKVRIIENIFIEELTFLFYLNLNNTVFPPSRSYRTDPSGKSNMLDCAMINEVNRLGSPRHCLMAILSKDNDIKQWFSDRISDVTSYRSQTLDKMSKFYNEVINSHQHIRVIPEQQDLTNI
jgi:hypothetical protein